MLFLAEQGRILLIFFYPHIGSGGPEVVYIWFKPHGYAKSNHFNYVKETQPEFAPMSHVPWAIMFSSRQSFKHSCNSSIIALLPAKNGVR